MTSDVPPQPRVRVSIEAFLRTGEFGPIVLDTSRADLRKCLGLPEDWSAFGTEAAANTAILWRYGSFEFHFDPSDAITLIYADDFEALIGSQTLDLDPWILHGGMRRRVIEPELQRAAIPFRETEAPDPTTCEQLTLGSGVTLLFVKDECADDPYEPPCGLYAISRWQGALGGDGKPIRKGSDEA